MIALREGEKGGKAPSIGFNNQFARKETLETAVHSRHAISNSTPSRLTQHDRSHLSSSTAVAASSVGDLVHSSRLGEIAMLMDDESRALKV